MFKPTIYALAVVSSSVAYASDMPPAMAEYIETELRAWVNDPEIVAAIKAQNTETGGLSQDDIIAQDNAWRAQVGTSETPLINEVLNAPVSDFLRGHLNKSGGIISEVFVMDSQGLNVGASNITSDYWQGDEAKFTETFAKGPGSVHVSEVELDESTQAYQGQVSFAVTDPDTGDVVGAITVGLNASAFF